MLTIWRFHMKLPCCITHSLEMFYILPSILYCILPPILYCIYNISSTLLGKYAVTSNLYPSCSELSRFGKERCAIIQTHLNKHLKSMLGVCPMNITTAHHIFRLENFLNNFWYEGATFSDFFDIFLKGFQNKQWGMRTILHWNLSQIAIKPRLEKLPACLCPCTYHACKSSLTYTKKRVRKLFLS